MKEEYKKKEEKELINRFEAFIKNGDSHYFDEESFLQIMSHYIHGEKLNKALKAGMSALEQDH